VAHLLTDELWQEVKPLLPPHKPRPRGGRGPVGDRVALAGVLFALKTGIGWPDLPREVGRSGTTCWRRLRDWQAAGVWEALHRLLLDEPRGAERIDFSRALVDSGSVRAVSGGSRPGRTRPTAARPAASTTSWLRPTGFRRRRPSRARTATTARS